MEPKLCINCKHCLRDAAKAAEFSRCNRPGAENINLVTGERSLWYCSSERESGCGLDGKYFEASA